MVGACRGRTSYGRRINASCASGGVAQCGRPMTWSWIDTFTPWSCVGWWLSHRQVVWSTRGVVVGSTRPHRGRASDGRCRVGWSLHRRVVWPWESMHPHRGRASDGGLSRRRVGWSLHRRAVREGKPSSEKRNGKENQKKHTFSH